MENSFSFTKNFEADITIEVDGKKYYPYFEYQVDGEVEYEFCCEYDDGYKDEWIDYNYKIDSIEITDVLEVLDENEHEVKDEELIEKIKKATIPILEGLDYSDDFNFTRD